MSLSLVEVVVRRLENGTITAMWINQGFLIASYITSQTANLLYTSLIYLLLLLLKKLDKPLLLRVFQLKHTFVQHSWIRQLKAVRQKKILVHNFLLNIFMKSKPKLLKCFIAIVNFNLIFWILTSFSDILIHPIYLIQCYFMKNSPKPFITKKNISIYHNLSPIFGRNSTSYFRSRILPKHRQVQMTSFRSRLPHCRCQPSSSSFVLLYVVIIIFR